MNEVSVVTIVRNRSFHLQWLIQGLTRSSILPRELIVVDMSDTPVVLPRVPFPTNRIDHPAANMPLAAARNAGAHAATGQRLLFLDVDCIPGQNLVAVMDGALQENDALLCPEVRYLGPNVSEPTDEELMWLVSKPHPTRVFPESGLRPELNAGLFWSLTFGVRRSSFERLGGFDEAYVGYGAEDTDFGYRARESDLPLFFLGGTCSFHQYHGVISPPLQHLSDIVKNANRFHDRHGTWPMEDWLKQFADMGLISLGANVSQLRVPTAMEMLAAKRPNSEYF